MNALDAKLRLACLWIAAFAIAVSVTCILFAPARVTLFPAAIFVGGIALLQFLRMLFSRPFREGIKAVANEMQGDEPWPGKSKKFLDADWGLFGKRVGSPVLLWVRAVLVLGIIPVFIIESLISVEVVWLWMAGSFVAMELSMLHAALPIPAHQAHA